MAAADGSELVAPALAELAGMTIGPAAATLSLFEAAAQDHLTRQDEIAVLIDTVRLEIQRTTDVAFTTVLQKAQELLALYAVLDRTEDAVNRAHGAARAAAERLSVLEGALSETAAPVGLAKMTAFFRGASGGGSGAGARVADAPVRLPPYDPPTLDVPAELAGLVAAAGGADALKMAAAAVAAGPAAASAAAAAAPPLEAAEAAARAAAAPTE